LFINKNKREMLRMEMRKINITGEKMKDNYVDNILGYIFTAQQENKNLLIIEDNIINKCKARDFWDKVRIDIMDIETENPKFKQCEYINNTLVFKYDNRTIKIKIAE